MPKNILDLKSKPNLGYGVNVKKVSSDSRNKSYEIKPRMPMKKKLKSVKDQNFSRAGFTNDIYNIWEAKKNTSTFDRRTPSKGIKSFWVVIFLLFMIALASILGWNFFSQKPLSGSGVDMEISADDKVVSGEVKKITIRYENKEQVKVKNVELRINYPEGIYYVNSNTKPNNLGMNVWDLGDLKPGESGKINLELQFTGNVNDELNLEARITYEPQNFSSNFETKVNKKITIEKTMMELSIESPNEVGNNNRVTYKISYKNISKTTLNNFRLKIEYPENFTVIETITNAEPDGENLWLIEEIKKDEINDLQVSGFLDLSKNSSSTLNAILQIKSVYTGDGFENNWITYLKTSKDIVSMPVDANLRVSVNNNSIDSALNWANELKYEISYKNNTENVLEDISIQIKLDSPYLNWETLQDDFSGDLDRKNFTITWDKDFIPSFAKLEKNQEGKINFSIKLLEFKDEYIGKNDYYVKSEAYLKHKKINDSQKIISNSVVNKINTPIEISSRVRYYNEESSAVGSGPLPPVVGETTNYEVVWELKSLASNLSEIYVRTILPPSVDWGEGTVLGNQGIVYNSETREVVWQIQDLEKGINSIAKFNVMLTPEKSQTGSVATLINQTNFSAIDSYSNAKIETSVPYLTTDLLGDKKASGKSKVIDL